MRLWFAIALVSLFFISPAHADNCQTRKQAKVTKHTANSKDIAAKPCCTVVVASQPVTPAPIQRVAQSNPTNEKGLICSEQLLSNGIPAVVCVQSAETSYATILISGFAVLLSIGSLVYTYRKDARARTQSIEDEFWLRKVLSPVFLEPLIKQVTDFSANLPGDCSLNQTNATVYQDFARECQENLQKLNQGILAILDRSLCDDVGQCIQDIEDELLDYCGENGKACTAKAPIVTKTKQATQFAIRAHLLTALTKVKNFQRSSGTKS